MRKSNQEKKNHQKALYVFLKSDSLLQEQGNPELAYRVYTSIAQLYSYKSFWRKSISYAMKAWSNVYTI